MLNSAAKWQARNLPVVLDRWRDGSGAPLRSSGCGLLALYSGRIPGLEPRDDAAVVGTIREAFEATSTAAAVTAALLALDVDDATRDRLAAEVTPLLADILAAGPRTALRSVAAGLRSDDRGPAVLVATEA